MVNKMYSLFTVIVLFMASCRFAIVPSYVKKQAYNFSHIPKKDSLNLNPKGYYYRDSRYNNYSIFFFKNNICAQALLGNDKNEIDENIKFRQDDANDYFYLAGYWGTYTISNDTIKTLMVNRPSFMSPTWMPYEDWYIVSSNNIKQIAHKKISDTVGVPPKNIERYLDDTKEDFYFYTNSEIPDYNKAWILKYKWFWKNEDEFLNWMKLHKIKK